MRSKTKTKLDKQNKKQKYYPKTNNQTSPSGREKEKHESKPKQQRSQKKRHPRLMTQWRTITVLVLHVRRLTPPAVLASNAKTKIEKELFRLKFPFSLLHLSVQYSNQAAKTIATNHQSKQTNK